MAASQEVGDDGAPYSSSFSSSTQSSTSFLWLSDIHLDPYYGQKAAMSRGSKDSPDCSSFELDRDTYDYGTVGCDAPLSLVEETLRHALENNSNTSNSFDFILITGDIVRHGTDQLDDPIVETRAILRQVHDTVRQYFRNTTVIPVLGNNDVTPDYYLNTSLTEGNNPLLSTFVDGMGEFLLDDEERTLFQRGGYFARSIGSILNDEDCVVTVISLNTILYSVNRQPYDDENNDEDEDDPMEQFCWLEKQLLEAANNNRVVYIAGHIPPSIGSYRKSQFWRQKYIDRYFEIVTQYFPDTIGGHLFGHLHTAEFRLLSPYDHNVRDLSRNNVVNMIDDTALTSEATLFPLWIASSVTPVYGSNPSYRVVDYERSTGRMLDYITTYIDLNSTYDNLGKNIVNDLTSSSSPPIWTRLPSFRETYYVPDLSLSSLKQLITELADDEDDDYNDGSDNRSQHRQQLWETFLSEQTVYASTEMTNIDDCPEECKVEWLCVIQATSKDSYDACLSISGTMSTFDGGASSSILDGMTIRRYAWMSTTFIVGLVVLGISFVMIRRYMKRRHYRQPTNRCSGADGLTIEEIDAHHVDVLQDAEEGVEDEEDIGDIEVTVDVT